MMTTKTRGKMAAITAAAALLATASQAPASDRSAFEAKVGKHAVGPYQAAKGICICQDGGANHYRVGYLIRGNFQDGNAVEITATCQIPKFDPIDGDMLSTAPCVTYEVIGR